MCLEFFSKLKDLKKNLFYIYINKSEKILLMSEEVPVVLPEEMELEVPVEQRAIGLCDSLKSQVEAISVDSTNLQRVITFMKGLQERGYPVEDSVTKLETEKSKIDTDLSEVSSVMEAKIASLKALADTLQDDLPTF